MVIHFSGEKQKTPDAVLRRDTLADFAAGRAVRVHAVPRNPARRCGRCAPPVDNLAFVSNPERRPSTRIACRKRRRIPHHFRQIEKRQC